MKFGFSMPNTFRVTALTQAFEPSVTGPDQTAMARRAEELGYDVIPIPEHFVVPKSHVELSDPTTFTPLLPRRSLPVPPNGFGLCPP